VQELNFLLTDTATTSALIFLVMGAATVFSNFIDLTGIATSLLHLITALGLSKLGLVILFSIIYVILGCFLDSISMLCITIPVFNPIVAAAGIDPIWYATIVITSVEIGLITPPVGLNLYAAKGVAEPDVTLEDVIAGILPFLAAEVVCLAIMMSFPTLCTFLPAYVG
jgi:C4-dicarboxylate transporter DctM subunit